MPTASSFGDPSRYYAAKKILPQDPEGLLSFSRVNDEVRQAFLDRHQILQLNVQRTVNSWNNQLRELIRNETGLKFSGGNERHTISVHVVDGLPLPLASAFEEISDPLLWEIVLNNATLKTTVTGLDVVVKNFGALGEWREKNQSALTLDELHNTRDLVAELIKWLESQSIKKRFQKIDEDVLGAYFFRKGNIQIYWMAICLIARILNVSVEGLTIAVCAHELVHAYTHVGSDIDGEQWETSAFANADLKIVEGLAQFYTAIVCKKLEGKLPGVSNAFEQLLSVQSPTYTEFRSWTKANERAGEIVRFSMIGSRKKKIGGYEEFQEEMKKVRERVGRGIPDAGASSG
jgi:hypothetical protein